MSKKILVEAVKTFGELDPALKAYLKDLLIAGGLVPKNKMTRQLPPSNDSSWQYFYDDAAVICEEISNGYFDFAEVDKAIYDLVENHYDVPKTPTETYDNARRWAAYCRKTSQKELATAIVAFASAMNAWWKDQSDDPRRQAVIDNSKANTLFGKMVGSYKRYTSDRDKQALKTANAAARAARAANNTGATGGATGGARQDDYKYLGPLSSQVKDLKGTPGSKITLSTPVFIITGTNTNSARVTPYAFVANLIPTEKGGYGKNIGPTNKVFYGSANGYRQYPLCFENQQDADAFLVEVQNHISVPANMTNMHVARVKADPNGYFKIGTEFGDAYVRASELNESLQEAAEEANKKDIAKKDKKMTDEERAARKLARENARAKMSLGKLPDDMLENFND